MAEELLEMPQEADLWEEDYWSMLLEQIEEGVVIPILGPDVFHVEIDGKLMLLDRYIGSQLARKYGVNQDGEPSLNDVVGALLQRGEQREPLYSAVHRFLASVPLKPPRALLQLAEITHFNLFVTTTFDMFLEEALKTVRQIEPKTLAYSPNKNVDVAREDLLRPTVYHLLGKASVLPYYVISEEDMLEFVHALQSESHRPKNLFDELRTKNLLILGENFPDWLARFFLRTAKQIRLSESRGGMEFLADARVQSDKNLVLFLQRFSKKTRMFRGRSPVDFVAELWKRWTERNPDANKPAAPSVSAGPAGADDMPAGAVFISYTHEDLHAVQRLRDELLAQGVSVWFDNCALQSGDRFNFKIRSYIEEQCSCFVMVISKNADSRSEGYFRKEWDLAIERDKGMAHTRAFIMPVVIDGTDPREFKTLRPELKKYTISSLPGGKVTPEFAARIKSIAAR
jgi:hypothetical protein